MARPSALLSSFMELYTFGGILGYSDYTQVRLAIPKDRLKSKQAVKYICNKRPYSEEVISRTIKAVKTLVHPNVIQIKEIFEGSLNTYFLMNYADNGSLYHHICQNGAMDEKLARHWFLMIYAAVQYLQSQKIVLVTLKPSNVMLFGCLENVQLKISNYGVLKWSVDLSKKKFFPSVAPEYTKKRCIFMPSGDVFSLGCILYFMLTAVIPFQNSKGDLTTLFTRKRWAKSSSAKRLLLSMLENDVFKRIRMKDIVWKSWFSK